MYLMLATLLKVFAIPFLFFPFCNMQLSDRGIAGARVGRKIFRPYDAMRLCEALLCATDGAGDFGGHHALELGI